AASPPTPCRISRTVGIGREESRTMSLKGGNMTIAARRWTFAITCLLMFGLVSRARAQGTCAAAACGNPTCLVNDAGGVDAPGCCAGAPPCKTIQGAVNDVAPGGVISVAAGTYTEPAAGPLTINKTVTLCGAQSGVDARGRAAAES